MGHKILVNVYRVQRAYGGPEEGGWWYPKGTLIEADFTDICQCNLPLIVAGDYDYWSSQADEEGEYIFDVSESQHAPDCGLHAMVDKARQLYSGHRDEWIPQEPDDDSPERVGEALKTGVIEVALSLHLIQHYPARRPTYA